MAEKTIEERVQEAKAAGYTDEEINAYLNPQPIAAPDENKRSEEYTGTAQFGALAGADTAIDLAKQGLKYGLPAYGVYKGGQAIANRIPTAPVAPSATTTPTTPYAGSSQQTFDILKTPTPTEPVTSVPQAQQQATTFLQRMAQQYGGIANKVAPVLQKAAPVVQGASKAVLPLMIAKDLFYTSPEERAILQRAEAEKRAKGWKPINER
jgi:hypothetical protein